MENSLEELKSLILNAKKSLNRPYSTDTVDKKKEEIEKLEEQYKKYLEKLDENVEELTTEFEKYKVEALTTLQQHLERKVKRTAIVMTNLNMNELSTITKLVPIFTGRREELHNFITNLGLVHGTIEAEKVQSFFSFIFKSRLDLKVQIGLNKTLYLLL